MVRRYPLRWISRRRLVPRIRDLLTPLAAFLASVVFACLPVTHNAQAQVAHFNSHSHLCLVADSQATGGGLSETSGIACDSNVGVWFPANPTSDPLGR